jgi:hypothetical protein
LLIETQSAVGITEEHVERLIEFADEMTLESPAR